VRIISDSSSISVDDALNLVELSEEKDSLPDSLSGGMKMRLSLARALYYDADIVLMDEPFSALDDDLKERILPKIFEILKDKIVIIVSHNLNEASKYADNIINLNNILN
jgi:ABC-type nitrate/sulfonate/bicarbonate transport system ATPase subunit